MQPCVTDCTNTGHDVIMVDNLSRRKIDLELGCDSLTPIQSTQTRLKVGHRVVDMELVWCVLMVHACMIHELTLCCWLLCILDAQTDLECCLWPHNQVHEHRCCQGVRPAAAHTRGNCLILCILHSTVSCCASERCICVIRASPIVADECVDTLLASYSILRYVPSY